MRIRWIGVIAMVAAVLAGFGANSAAAQSEQDGTMWLTAFVCPPGFEDGNYADCQLNPLENGEFSYLVSAEGSAPIPFTTNAEGVAIVTLPAVVNGGAITVPQYEGIDHFIAFCGLEGQPAIEDIMRYLDDGRGVALFNLPQDAQVSCTFYFVPEGSDEPSEEPVVDRGMTIYNAICEGSPVDGDYFAACYDNIGVGNVFRVGIPNTDAFSENQVSDENGYVSFLAPDADVIRIVQELPTNAIDWAAYCTTTDGDVLELTYVTDYAHLGVVDVTVAGSEGSIRCDWYTVLSVEVSPPPSVQPSVAPSVTPTAAPSSAPTARPSGVIGLPNTGAGAGASANVELSMVLGLVAAAMIAAAATIGLRARNNA